MAKHTGEDPAQHRYNQDNELHVRAIDRLVHELGISAEEVNRSYREVLEELSKDSTIKAFLPILVSRGVKKQLLENGEHHTGLPEKRSGSTIA